MSLVNNPKTLVRLWAALHSDFEMVMAKYMGSKGWRYVDFAKICRETQLTLIMHVTQGRGKTKDEHYDRITDMILQVCKELWLRAGEKVGSRQKTNVDELMERKRGLGGFFLLYTLYEKQAIPDRVKISLSMKDLKALIEFIDDIKHLDFCKEVQFMLQYLMFKDAFFYCIFSETFRFETPVRYFLNTSRSEVVDLIRRMRSGQDILAYSSLHKKCQEVFQKLSVDKNSLAKDVLQTVDPTNWFNHWRNRSTFQNFVKTVPSDNLPKALRKLDELVDKPILTLQSLTATEAIGRRMTMETIRRMGRARKKAVQALDRDGEHKAARPYVREGGIFGRKKEVVEDDKGKKRERGACNGNLWTYINGFDFDKPMGEQRARAPPAPAAEQAKCFLPAEGEAPLS